MLPRVFAKFFWDVYDFLGRLILANILCCMIMAGLLGVIITAFYPFFTTEDWKTVATVITASLFVITALPFPAAAFIHFLSRVSDEAEPEFRDFFRGLKRHYWPLMKLTFAFTMCFLILFSNIFFYAGRENLPQGFQILFFAVAGVCFWIGVCLLAMMLYAYPIAVHQGVGIKKSFVRSFLLVLDNPGVTIYSLILLIGIAGLSLVTKGVLLFVLSLALITSLSNSLYVNVMEKYERIEEEKRLEEESKDKPASWKEIKHKEFLEDRHDRYKRSLKDILKPWEY